MGVGKAEGEERVLNSMLSVEPDAGLDFITQRP